MAAKAKQPVSVPITAVLNPGAYEFLEKNAPDGDVNALLAKWIAFWMDSQARGGLMLSPEDHEYLATLNEGRRFRGSRDLTEAVARGLKRDEGQFTQHVPVDPAWEKPLKEAADVMGFTPEDLLTDVVNTCMANGWAYAWTPQNQIIATDDDYRVIAEFVGKKVFFGSELADALRGLKKQKVAA